MKKTNNKGFSLVELIIVIAIMAILIGVLAPQYIKYVEKSRVSADKDLLDSVYNACTIAASDPDVKDNVPGDNVGTADFDEADIAVGTGADDEEEDFFIAVGNTLGTDIAGVQDQLKSKQALEEGSDNTIQITTGPNGDFIVTCGAITVPETAVEESEGE